MNITCEQIQGGYYEISSLDDVLPLRIPLEEKELAIVLDREVAHKVAHSLLEGNLELDFWTSVSPLNLKLNREQADKMVFYCCKFLASEPVPKPKHRPQVQSALSQFLQECGNRH